MDIKIIDPPSKPKISYDDILSSLKMTLVNGKLQISRGDILEKNTVLRDQLDTSKPINKVIANPVLYQHQLQMQRQQSQQQAPPPLPLTEEERKQRPKLSHPKDKVDNLGLSEIEDENIAALNLTNEEMAELKKQILALKKSQNKQISAQNDEDDDEDSDSD